MAPNSNPPPEHLERRRQVRGLMILAIVALTFAILRAGAHTLFGPGLFHLK